MYLVTHHYLYKLEKLVKTLAHLIMVVGQMGEMEILSIVVKVLVVVDQVISTTLLELDHIQM